MCFTGKVFISTPEDTVSQQQQLSQLMPMKTMKHSTPAAAGGLQAESPKQPSNVSPRWLLPAGALTLATVVLAVGFAAHGSSTSNTTSVPAPAIDADDEHTTRRIISKPTTRLRTTAPKPGTASADVAGGYGRQLHAAASAGDVLRLRALLDGGADPNALNIHGFAPLHLAAASKGAAAEAAIETLVRGGAAVNARDASTDIDGGRTALHHALMHGRGSHVALLCSLGADASIANGRGYTPLHHAAERAEASVVAALLRCGASLEARGKNGYSALHLAAFNGREAMGAALLEAGADPHAQGTEGFTPLHAAVFGNRSSFARQLLQRGVEVDLPSKEGYTPLHVAAYNQHLALAQDLLDAGASPHATSVFGESPLHKAAAAGAAELAQLLLARGATLDVADLMGDTPLHVATHFDDATVRVMVAHEIEHQQLRRHGDAFWRSVQHAAAWAGSHDALRMLLPAAHTRGDDALTAALIVAAERGRSETITFLLEHGVSTGAGDASMVASRADGAGRSPLEAAAASGRCAAVQLLLSHGATPAKASGSATELAARCERERAAAAWAEAAWAEPGAQLPAEIASVLPNAQWRERAREMTPLTRRLLVLDTAPSAVDAAALLRETTESAPLSKYLAARAALHAEEPAALLRAARVLDAAACARLRAAVDANGTASVDSVDRLREHVLYVRAPELRQMLGDAALEALLALPRRFLQDTRPPPPLHTKEGTQRSKKGRAPRPPPGSQHTLFDCFLRRYSPAADGDQLLTSFHMDTADVTVNVALTDDAQLEGGVLLGVYGHGVHSIVRAEGDATVHSSSLLHGVTRMRAGTRYSMIMFHSPLRGGGGGMNSRES